MSNELNETFNVTDQPSNIVPVQETPLVVMDGVSEPSTALTPEVIQEDYETARKNVYDLIAMSQTALTYALEMAKESEHPRAFEALSALLKQATETNAQLLDIAERKQRMDKLGNVETEEAKTTNNTAIFVGSTAELNNMIREATRGE